MREGFDKQEAQIWLGYGEDGRDVVCIDHPDYPDDVVIIPFSVAKPEKYEHPMSDEQSADIASDIRELRRFARQLIEIADEAEWWLADEG